jgi:hypothetical protein
VESEVRILNKLKQMMTALDFRYTTFFLLLFSHLLSCISIKPPGSLSTLIMPAAIYLKLMPLTSPLIWRARFLLLLGMAVMFTVVALTVLDFVD